jgi:Flp pilus assembly protein TadG
MHAGYSPEQRNWMWLLQLTSAEASQLLEFAITLPLLVVLVVGIFDFGGAFNLKHQLTNAAREGARFGGSLPLTDVSVAAVPSAVMGAWQVVDAYLLRSEINDCGLASATPALSGSTYIWTSTTSTTPPAPCPASLVLTIEPAYAVRNTVNNTDLICTKVTISYPYQWHFNSVIQLLMPGTTYGATLQVAADAVMPNME